MKIKTITIFLTLAGILFSCQEPANQDLDSGNEKALYLQQELEKHEVADMDISPAMGDPNSLLALNDYSYAQLDSIVANIVKTDQENKFYGQFDQSILDAFDEALMSAQTPQDYLKVIENFPKLAKQSGLQAKAFKKLQ